MTVITWVRSHLAELGRFGAVGIAGLLVNLGVFNLLRIGPLSPSAEIAGDDDRVVTAKVIATLVSMAFTWLAHRHWTFRGQRRHTPTRELVLFLTVNVVSMVVEASIVGFSHHVLGFTSLLADNVASVVGIGVGTVVRYTGYKVFVFSRQGRVSGDDDEERSPSRAG